VPTTFVQTSAVNNNVIGFQSNVTLGNILIVAYADSTAATGIADTMGNTWTLVAPGGANEAAVWWAKAKSTGPCSLTISATVVNPGLVIAEYAGPNGASGSSPYQIIGANATAVNAGPATAVAGAFTVIYNFGQSTTYVSSSGGTPRQSPFGTTRLNLIDNVSATGSYTETGTMSGGSTNQFGGSAITIGLGLAPAATPTYSPVAGSYGSSQSVTITCTTPSSTITYTTDGSTPVPGSHGTVYSGPVSVTTTQTIKAVASATNFVNSAEADATYTITGGGTPGSAPSSGLQSVQFFGRLPNGQIAAVAVDTHGNLAISGGTGGAINTVDVLGNGQATPAMLYGATPSRKVVAVAVDANGNLCATVGTGGGNPNTTVDIAAYAVPTPVQVVGREPISGTLYAVPLNASNALFNSVNPGSTPTASLAAPLAKPRKLILCGRTPSGQIVAVALDASGRLCISGSGSSGSVNVVDVYKNGQPLGIQIFGINASGSLQAVPLDANGNLSLS
jgi:hypothetical protein